jgi:hypothetical protein
MRLTPGGRGTTPGTCGTWTAVLCPRLYVALQTGGFAAREHYAVFGHSAGAQFVHRQLTFGYAGEVAIAISANAGTYTMPDPHTPFPCGIDGTDAEFPSLLSFPLTIMAGIADNNADEPFVPGNPGSLPQGAHRHEWAHRYFAEGQAVASPMTASAWPKPPPPCSPRLCTDDGDNQRPGNCTAG